MKEIASLPRFHLSFESNFAAVFVLSSSYFIFLYFLLFITFIKIEKEKNKKKNSQLLYHIYFHLIFLDLILSVWFHSCSTSQFEKKKKKAAFPQFDFTLIHFKKRIYFIFKTLNFFTIYIFIPFFVILSSQFAFTLAPLLNWKKKKTFSTSRLIHISDCPYLLNQAFKGAEKVKNKLAKLWHRRREGTLFSFLI